MSETPAPQPVARVNGDRASVPAVPQPLVIVLASIAVLATIVGRTIAPALPGSAAGIDAWIRAAELGGAILSVNLLLGASVLLVWLSLCAMLSRELPVAFRTAVLPAVAVVIVLSVAAYRVVLYPSWLLWLSFVSAGLAMLAVPRALSVPVTRGPGLLLGIGAATSLLEVGARVTAIRAGELAHAGMFELARWIATVAFGLDVIALALVLVWASGKRPRVGFILMACAFVLSSIVAWGALNGARFGASPWMVVAARSLGEMMRHPMPLVQPFVRFALEVMTLFLAGAVLLAPGKRRSLTAAVSLVLLAGGATDIPLCAMMLTVAALVIPLTSPGEAVSSGVAAGAGSALDAVPPGETAPSGVAAGAGPALDAAPPPVQPLLAPPAETPPEPRPPADDPGRSSQRD